MPPLAPDEVLVHVGAAAISPGDRALVTGVPYVNRLTGAGLRRPENAIPGFDVAGTVDVVGSAVTGLAVGDEVCGSAQGARTDLAVAEAGQLARRPDGWSRFDAAAVPVSGCVALQAVRDRAAIGADDEVAVIGAGGGVGTYVTQLAVARGARVTAVCGTDKVMGVAALGVDEVIDHHLRDLRDVGRSFDIVIDTVGRTPLRRIVPMLTPTGHLVILGADHTRRVTGGLGRWLRAIVWSVASRRRLHPFVARPLDAPLLADLVDEMVQGHLRPAVDDTFTLSETARAFEYLDHRTRPGKVVIIVGPD